MWSEVRGRLPTLKPLSVLSLREWALRRKRPQAEPRVAAGVAEKKPKQRRGAGTPSQKDRETSAPVERGFVAGSSDPDIQRGDQVGPVVVQPSSHLVPARRLLKCTDTHTAANDEPDRQEAAAGMRPPPPGY